MIDYFPGPHLAPPKPSGPVHGPKQQTIEAIRPRAGIITGQWGRWTVTLNRIEKLKNGHVHKIFPALTASQISTLRSAAKYRGIGLHVQQSPRFKPKSTYVWKKGPRAKFNRKGGVNEQVS